MPPQTFTGNIEPPYGNMPSASFPCSQNQKCLAAQAPIAALSLGDKIRIPGAPSLDSRANLEIARKEAESFEDMGKPIEFIAGWVEQAEENEGLRVHLTWAGLLCGGAFFVSRTRAEGGPVSFGASGPLEFQKREIRYAGRAQGQVSGKATSHSESER